MNTSPTPSLTVAQLKMLLAENPRAVLLDVLPPESFAEEHLPGARNACVYQTDFLDCVQEVSSDRSQTIVVYDSSVRNLASGVAMEKLAAAGFTDVREFKGGLTEWREAGGPVEGRGPAERKPRSQTCRVDPDESLVEWTGRNLANKHHGTVRISRGEFRIENDVVRGGEITLDMTTIANTDIADHDMAGMLAQHLMSDDFFDTAKHPEAKVSLREIAPLPGSTPGSPTHIVHGTLELKGVAQPVEFAASIGAMDDGRLAAQASFDIDRTRWNVRYGSGKFFERLGKHLVNDLISIQLKIVAG